MPFHEIMERVQQGEVDAGIIIHESRFTYSKYGLREVVDLGKWWEETTGHPIPLGGILARRELGADLIGRMDRALRASVEYAHSRPDQVRGYVRDHAQEMEDDVMEAHIQLYVNTYTLDYEPDGEAAHYLVPQPHAEEALGRGQARRGPRARQARADRRQP